MLPWAQFSSFNLPSNDGSASDSSTVNVFHPASVNASPAQVWASYFGPVQYGYATCYAINAKNSFGGYTGEKTHYILIKNDIVIKHVYGKGGQYDIGESAARKGCSTF